MSVFLKPSSESEPFSSDEVDGGVEDGVGNTALKSSEADIQPRLTEISIASCAKLDFSIDAQFAWKSALHPAANNCSELLQSPLCQVATS
jgi:hypothetical protein